MTEPQTTELEPILPKGYTAKWITVDRQLVGWCYEESDSLDRLLQIKYISEHSVACTNPECNAEIPIGENVYELLNKNGNRTAIYCSVLCQRQASLVAKVRLRAKDED